MPMIPGVKDTFDKLWNLHQKKNDDYSGNRGVFFNFDFCTYVSNLFSDSRDKVYAIFIAVKLARLSVLLSQAEAKPKNESIEDSFDDLIMYATIWKCNYMSRFTKVNESEVDSRADRLNTK